jgi:UDP-N-acetylmuramoyl-tripeptide--D-alanyl-D-alanine ligase
MLELGEAADSLHRQVGRYAAEHGIDLVIGVHGSARTLVDAAGGDARFFEEPTAAGDFVRSIARPGDAILFKGSRGIRMELALERVLA